MARRKTVKPIDLDKAIEAVLAEYGDDVYKVLGVAVKDVSDEAVRKLEQVNHFAPGGHPTGAYSRDWVADDEKTILWRPYSRISSTTFINEVRLLR